MLKKDQVLRMPVDFDNAIFMKIPIIVWQDGEIVDYGGVIETHNNESVKINGSYFFKNACEFRVR